MTVIRPNSVSGITSITAQANEINVFRSNGTLAGLNLNGVNFNTTAGISTLAALKVTGNVDIAGVLTYQDVTNVDSLGIGTFRTGINVSGGQLDVGSNIKLGNAGVITATSFVGSGANLTSLPIGGANALSLNDNVNLNLGTGNDGSLFNGGNYIFLKNHNGGVAIQASAGNVISLQKYDNSDIGLQYVVDGAIKLYHDNTPVVETTDNGLKFIQGSGNLIKYGTTSEFANAAININRGGNGYANIRLSSNYGCGLFMAGANDNTDEFGINQDNQKNGYLDNRGGFISFNTGTSGVARMRVENSAQVTFMGNALPSSDGGYDLGGSSNRWRSLYTSAGLYIGGTGNANKLDAYIEGTWSPSINRSSSAASVTLSRQDGHYIRVGNVIHIWFDIVVSSASGGGGSWWIAGLPFTPIVGSTAGGYGAPTFRSATAMPVRFRTNGSSSWISDTAGGVIYLMYYDDGGTEQYVNGYGGTGGLNNGRITGQAFYFENAAGA